MMNEKLALVESVSGLMEGEILRGMLESFGLTVSLSQESAGRVYGLGVGRLARVDILVPSDQAEKARQILADYRAGRLQTDEDTESD